MAQINFSLDDFSSLSYTEYLDKWSPIGLEDLNQPEQATLLEFLGYLPKPRNRDEIDPDNLLLVRAQEGGLFNKLFGPSIFGDSGELVLKVGENEFLVSQSTEGFICGTLAGELNIANKPITVRVNGGEAEREFWPASVLFYPSGDEAVSDNLYRDPAVLKFTNCSWSSSIAANSS